jgi:hypothetical protein|tara:strand:- start:16195 stop:16350 length:156 start_codon:yes stop_codon:yes gene_type:complete
MRGMPVLTFTFIRKTRDDAVLDLMQKWNNLAKGSLNHSLKLQVAQLLLFLP